MVSVYSSATSVSRSYMIVVKTWWQQRGKGLLLTAWWRGGLLNSNRAERDELHPVVTVITQETTDKSHDMIFTNQQKTHRYTVTELGMSEEQVPAVIHKKTSEDQGISSGVTKTFWAWWDDHDHGQGAVFEVNPERMHLDPSLPTRDKRKIKSFHLPRTSNQSLCSGLKRKCYID